MAPARFLSRVATTAAALLIGALIAGTSVTGAHADDLADLEAKLSKARSDAKTTKSQLSSVMEDLEHSDAELAKAYEQLEETRAQIPVAKAELEKANGEYEVAQREADTIKERLANAREERTSIATKITENEENTERARRGIAQMARDYAAGNFKVTSVEIMVGASDFSQVMADYNLSQTALRTEADAMRALREANAIATNMQVRLDATEDAISALQEQAAENVVTTKTAAESAKTAKEKLENLESTQTKAANQIEARKQAELQRQAELAAEQDALSDDIQKLIGLTKAERARIKKEREEAERKERERLEKERKRTGSTNSGGSSSGGSSSGAKGSGFLSYPTANPYITSSYGQRYHPVLHYWRLHAGTDFRAYCGTPIYAAGKGKVEWAYMRSGLGNQVMINHGTVDGANLMSSYNHLSRFAVHAGQSVKKGDLVGYAGATGTVTACHLHFEVYVNGSTVDPMTRL